MPRIMTAGVKVIPEVDQVIVDESKSMWVAVEVGGHVGPVNGMECHYSLDVVVVVDDS
jgi:hypothetical protein